MGVGQKKTEGGKNGNKLFLTPKQSSLLFWRVKIELSRAQDQGLAWLFSVSVLLVELKGPATRWSQLKTSENETFLTDLGSEIYWAKPVPSKCLWSLDASSLNYVPVLPSCLMPYVILPSARCQEPSCQVARCQAACCYAYRCRVPAPSVPDWSCKLLGYPS